MKRNNGCSREMKMEVKRKQLWRKEGRRKIGFLFTFLYFLGKQTGPLCMVIMINVIMVKTAVKKPANFCTKPFKFKRDIFIFY